MSDIVENLNRKAAMIAAGEKIGWGSDTELMREAANEITRLCSLTEWRFDLESAPEGEVVNVLARYESYAIGCPRYAMKDSREEGWFEFTKNPPERVIPWAWRPRPDWPEDIRALKDNPNE